MRYHCLATDYDGTLALHGHVEPKTVAALERLRESGRRLLLVTGRELEELLGIFPEIHLFDYVVAENGALLYQPEKREIRLLGDPPDQKFVDKLRERGVAKLSVGRVIVATWEPYESLVLEVIRDLGLGLQVIFNKGAVMILPSGMTKATGLAAALAELGLSRHNVVAVGDAENDHAFLSACECGVAVSNALDALKERADWVTQGDHGDGVIELAEALLADDLASLEPRLTRHDVLLGNREEKAVNIHPFGRSVLIAGSSGSGKSTLASGLLERLADCGYQCCVVDPEGDYSTLEGFIALGTPQQAPTVDEVLQLLQKPKENAVANLTGLRLADRPDFFSELLARLQDLRARRGRPHWIVVDEAHHVLPAQRTAGETGLPQQFEEMIFITVEPESVLPAALAGVDVALTVGREPLETLREFCQVIGEPPPAIDAVELAAGEALYYRRGSSEPPGKLHVVPGRSERRRHRRKYAEGDLGEDRSFYFRGPKDKLNLRAQNLILFTQIADGVDDETWLHHLQRGDYSRWFREGVKDQALAKQAEPIEKQRGVSAAESRARIKALVEQHYTLPAETILAGDLVGEES